MAAVHFKINGVAVPCPPDVEEKGPAAMQAWFDAEQKKTAPKKAEKPTATPEKE